MSLLRLCCLGYAGMTWYDLFLNKTQMDRTRINMVDKTTEKDWSGREIRAYLFFWPLQTKRRGTTWATTVKIPPSCGQHCLRCFQMRWCTTSYMVRYKIFSLVSMVDWCYMGGMAIHNSDICSSAVLLPRWAIFQLWGPTFLPLRSSGAILCLARQWQAVE